MSLRHPDAEAHEFREEARAEAEQRRDDEARAERAEAQRLADDAKIAAAPPLSPREQAHLDAAINAGWLRRQWLLVRANELEARAETNARALADHRQREASESPEAEDRRWSHTLRELAKRPKAYHAPEVGTFGRRVSRGS